MRVRSEVEPVVVRLSEGEFLQYVFSTQQPGVEFALKDDRTQEVILSHRVFPTIQAPPTFTRLWPLVGDCPQRESAFVMTLQFAPAGGAGLFQLQHRKLDASWSAAIDIDFEAAGATDYSYRFLVLAE